MHAGVSFHLSFLFFASLSPYPLSTRSRKTEKRSKGSRQKKTKAETDMGKLEKEKRAHMGFERCETW